MPVHPYIHHGSARISSLVSHLPQSNTLQPSNRSHRLVLKGRDDEALTVLAALSDLPEDDPKIQSEFQAVKDVAYEMSKGGFRNCFDTNKNRNLHRTILAYVNQVSTDG